MPGAGRLLSAYKLSSIVSKLGLTLTAPVKQEHSISDHPPTYSYHYELVLSPKKNGSSTSTSSVRSALKAAISTDRTVLSHYQNPYHCHLSIKSVSKSSSGGFRVVLSGHSRKEN